MIDLTSVIAAKGGRPWSVLVAAGGVTLPSSLLVYLTRPDLFEKYGLAGGIFFGLTIGFPTLFACSWLSYALLRGSLKLDQISRSAQSVLAGALPSEPALLDQVTAEDPLEWPTLLTGGWGANVVLYLLVVIAYFKPLILGATLVLTVGIVMGLWALLGIALLFAVLKLEKRVAGEIAAIRKMREDLQRGARGRT